VSRFLYSDVYVNCFNVAICVRRCVRFTRQSEIVAVQRMRRQRQRQQLQHDNHNNLDDYLHQDLMPTVEWLWPDSWEVKRRLRDITKYSYLIMTCEVRTCLIDIYCVSCYGEFDAKFVDTSLYIKTA